MTRGLACLLVLLGVGVVVACLCASGGCHFVGQLGCLVCEIGLFACVVVWRCCDYGLMCQRWLAHKRGGVAAWGEVWLVFLCCRTAVWWLLAYVRAVAGTFGTSERELAHWLDGWIHWRGGRQH